MAKEILVVDDQAGIRLLLEDVLTNEGYQVKTVATGKEALELIERHVFDMIVLDYRLPVYNGIYILQWLEERAIDTPVIVMTGMEDAAKNEISKTGIQVDVLGKPFNIVDLCTIVKDKVN
ncbi:MAG TPA: response regulator [Virgibacillus sp.]|nr:response regulator [Virgibacillus sp.]